MASKTKRNPTKYPGVFFRVGKSRVKKGKTEKIFYIYFKKHGKVYEEKVGKEFEDQMTPAAAAVILGERIANKRKSRKEIREAKKAAAKKKVWTVAALWEEYQDHNYNKSSLKQDKSRYDLYLKKTFAQKEPENLIPLEIDRLRIGLLKTKSPQTTKHILSLLRRLLNFGAKKGLCAPLPFKIEMPKVDNETTEDLTTEQIRRLLNVIAKDPHPVAGDIMKMALFSGMRKNEIFKLQWSDIDFRRGFISIRDPKGGESQKIPLNDSSRLLLKGLERTSVFVFPSPRGGGQITDLNKAFNQIKKAAKLPKNFRPMHGLRHTYASMLASSGKVDLYTLQRLLTHKSPDLTQRYAHLRDSALKKAANVASSLIGEALNSSSSNVDSSHTKKMGK